MHGYVLHRYNKRYRIKYNIHVKLSIRAHTQKVQKRWNVVKNVRFLFGGDFKQSGKYFFFRSDL